MKTLRELYAEHHGKLSDKWSLYLDAYEDALSPATARPVRLLEIGVQNGGSMEIWPRYFREGHLFVGCDVDPACAQLTYDDPRVQIVVGNANVDETQERILGLSDQYDIVIDDGSHSSGDIVRSFARYFPHLSEGGLYIAEDLHCSYWERTEGGLHYPYSSMSFFKLLVDVLNHEHWGIPARRGELLQGVLAHYGMDVSEDLLSQIHSVSFANSLCFIRKLPASRNVLGERVFAGEEDLVVPGLRHRAEVVAMRNEELANPWSLNVVPPAEMLIQGERRLASLRTDLALEQRRVRKAARRADTLERQLEDTQRQAERAEDALRAVLHSTSWRMVSRLHPVLNWLKGVQTPAPAAEPAPTEPTGPGTPAETYAEWLASEAKHAEVESERALQDIGRMPAPPLISVLMPVYNTPEALLRKAIGSVQGQLYPHWELCIADDASTDPGVRAVLAELAATDPRIHVVHRPVNGHISEASNTALEMARGEFVALFDHDDELHPFALYRIAADAAAHPDAELFFTDEDKIDEEGRRSTPYFKCDFNHELLLSHNMICHLGVYRRRTLREIGGFRKGFEGAQDYDLALRFIERVGPERVRHIPRVLYHWRMHALSTAAAASAKPYATQAARMALAEHLQRTNTPGKVVAADEIQDMHRVIYALPTPEPSVDIIVPTRDRADLMKVVLETLFEKTQYGNFRVIVVDNGSVQPETHALFAEWTARGRVSVLRIEAPFNFSRLNNEAVATSQADFVCLLNNDIEVIDGDWLREMVSQAVQPGVGCVGARLWYPNGTLQHGGVVLGVGGVAGHAHKHAARGALGYFGRAVLQQSFSAVTAACLVVRRSVYLQVGGLDAGLQVAFNDVDFCLRVRDAGYRNVWTPYAQLVHHESISRGYEDTPEKKKRFEQEATVMKERWGDELHADPAYSPHLTLEHEDFSLRAGGPRGLW